MQRGLIQGVLVLAVAAAAVGVFVTRATPIDSSPLAGRDSDPAKGETVFIASGCASCHAAPDAEGDAKLILAGGQRFPSDFGTFIAPNISPDPEAGIGAWTLGDFASAVKKGVSPDGQHYYPAFPYGAYLHMDDQDVVDLWAYWQTLPRDATPSQPHEVGFPFNIRRSVGVWKLLYLKDDWAVQIADTPELERGQYLVEALAHCGECHTPRDALGGMNRANWLGGAPNPTGRGMIPSLRPADLTWGPTEIVYYLETGFTPDFDSAGGHMVAVIENFAKLPASDREAVAAYLKVLP